MTKVIGLTGGIGSGKSTVARYFQEWGVPVYFADDAAKLLMNSPAIVDQIQDVFGTAVFKAGELNRQMLAEVVFSDREKLQQLNAIVHPAVRQHFMNWVQENGHHDFVIKEAAILFESGSYKDCDAIITVTAPLQERIARVVERDGAHEDDILKRIKNQWDDDKKIALSNYVIHNSTREHALQQTREIYDKLHNSSAV